MTTMESARIRGTKAKSERERGQDRETVKNNESSLSVDTCVHVEYGTAVCKIQGHLKKVVIQKSI